MPWLWCQGFWNTIEAFPNLKKYYYKTLGTSNIKISDRIRGETGQKSVIRIDAAREVKIAGDIDLLMPKFMVECTLDLNKHLVQEVYNLKNILFNKQKLHICEFFVAFGLEQIFSKDADFLGILTAPELVQDPLRVSDVIQMAFIEVMKEALRRGRCAATRGTLVKVTFCLSYILL